MQDDIVIVGAARTPIGRLGGTLASLRAVDLGAAAIAGAVERAGCDPTDVKHVVMGHVLQAGQGQITARQAAIAAGLGMAIPAETINKVCLSGMTAIARARDLVALGHAEVVVAGGMESMSQAPYILDRARFGYRFGHAEVRDSLLHDGLTCAIDRCSMGEATEQYQRDHALDISRGDQDEWSARSHARAAAARDSGAVDTEIVPVTTTGRQPATVTSDEGIRDDADAATLAGLRAAFVDDGTITAGNASQISDGAAAVVVTTRRFADQRGLDVLAVIDGWATVAGPDPSLHFQPSAAITAAAGRLGVDPSGFDRYEINEAFASVAVASTRALGIDPEVVNVRGGAIALGHPIGCSGARLVVTLVDELRQRGGGRGAAALCGGGGQGDAMIVTVG
ncbi:MAG: acetyl-CoA C-acyltransferase [Nitriliruptoraceae bacterium]